MIGFDLVGIKCIRMINAMSYFNITTTTVGATCTHNFKFTAAEVIKWRLKQKLKTNFGYRLHYIRMFSRLRTE